MGMGVDKKNWNAEEQTPDSDGKSFNVDKTSLPEQRRIRYQQYTKWRRHFSIWVMTVVPVWLLAVIVLVYISILGGYDIAASILNTLLATTTVNILGLAYIILKGIFPDSSK